MEFKGLSEKCKKVNTFVWVYKIIQNFCLGILVTLLSISIYFIIVDHRQYLNIALPGVFCSGIIYFILNYYYSKILNKIMFKNTNVFYMEVLKDLPRRILKQPTDSEKEDAVKRIINILDKICKEAEHQSKIFAENYYRLCVINLIALSFALSVSNNISDNTFNLIYDEIENFIKGGKNK